MTTTTDPITVLELRQVPPGELVLESNIRVPDLDPGLVDSIRQLGVLEPITAIADNDSRLVVRFGHRRTLAAVEAGLAFIPVVVLDAAAGDLSDDALRVISQRDENVHRAGLTAADEVGVVEQLVAFGLTAEEISTRARITPERVGAAVATSKSKLAKAAAAKYSDLTLDQAAAAAEFDDDPEVAKALIVTAIERPSQFAHELQRRRSARASAAAQKRVLAVLEKKGVTVLERAPYTYERSAAVALSKLNTADGKKLVQRNHADCPGHVAWLDHVGGEQIYEAVFGCSEPRKHGHTARPDAYVPQLDSRSSAPELSEKDREKAKQERRLVIDNNKAWDAAQIVRREWLAEFAGRKIPPKGAAAFIATTISRDVDVFTRMGNLNLEAAWLSLPKPSWGTVDLTKAVATATENRALVVALVGCLAAHEETTSRVDWRSNGKDSRAGRYLRFLESAGYTLSDVEKFAVSTKTV